MIFLHWISNLDIYYWIAGRDKSRVFQSIFRHDSAFYKCYVSSSGRLEVRPRPPPLLGSQNSFTEFRFLKMLQKPSSPLIGQLRHSLPLIGQHMDHRFMILESVKDTKGTRVWLLQLSRERSNLGGKMLGKCKYQGRRRNIDIGTTTE